MNTTKERKIDWRLVNRLYDSIVALLTFKQYNQWTTDSDGKAIDDTYVERFARLSKVTKSERALKLAQEAMHELSRG